MTTFHSISSAEDNCCVCLVPFSDLDEVEAQRGIVAHGDNLHPGHRKCMQELSKVSNLCPICRIPFEKSSLFNWKDRVITDMKLAIKNVTLSMTLTLSIVAIAFTVGMFVLCFAKSPFFKKTSFDSIPILLQIMTMQLGNELIQIGVLGGVALHAFKKSSLYLK